MVAVVTLQIGLLLCLGTSVLNVDGHTAAGGLGESDIKNFYAVLETISDLDQAVLLWNYAVARKKSIANNGTVTEVNSEARKKFEILADIPNIQSVNALWFQARSVLMRHYNLDVADVDTVHSLVQILDLELSFFRYLYSCTVNKTLGKWTNLLDLGNYGQRKDYEVIIRGLTECRNFLRLTEINLERRRVLPPTIIMIWGLSVMFSPYGTKLEQVGDLTDYWMDGDSTQRKNKACYDATTANIAGIPDVFEVERIYRMTTFLYLGANTSAYQGDDQLGADVSSTYVYRCLDSLVGTQREWFRGRYMQASMAKTQIGTFQDIITTFKEFNRVIMRYISDARNQGYPGFPNDIPSADAFTYLDGLEAPYDRIIERAMDSGGRNDSFILSTPMDMTDKRRLFDMRLLNQSWELHYAKPILTLEALAKLPQPFYTVTGQMGTGIENIRDRNNEAPLIVLGFNSGLDAQGNLKTTVDPNAPTTPLPTPTTPVPGLSGGAIAGIVFAGLIGLFLLLAVLYFVYTRMTAKTDAERGSEKR